ncbi:MAG: DeoR/GlpR transcriptional regulator [Clostridia bacterium]|nr:DeoR/GlpR transcriptional regulator [Clostridia bacterium]
MIQFDRQQTILKYLQKQQSATVKELARTVYASEASVRRDIETLEQEGLVKRVYGGVILSEYKNEEVPISLRDSENARIKEQIARRAADMIPDGSTVLLDSSSTTRRIVKYLGQKRDLRIITNNLAVFGELEHSHVEAYCTGGTFRRKSHDLVGPAAESYLRSVSADLVFFSSQGLSSDGEITDVSEELCSIRRVMLERAAQRIFLCDSSKLGVRRVFTLCRRTDVDEILCDVPLPWED